MNAGDDAWADALNAAALFAVHPAGTGVVLRARAGPVRERWLATVRTLLPSSPVRAVPLHVSDERLLGGLDLAATLRAGRPVASRGLLAEVDGGVLQVSMAERMERRTAAHIAAAIDAGEPVTIRDGVALHGPARFGVIAFDEGIDDEAPPNVLTERLAFRLWLDDVSSGALFAPLYDADDIADARSRYPGVRIEAGALEALCAATIAYGISSARAVLFAMNAARASAALDQRDRVTDGDVALAARLVLAPRATILPAAESPEAEREQGSTDRDHSNSESETDAGADRPLDDIVLTAVRAAIPAGLLAELSLGGGIHRRARSSGKSGVQQKLLRHGRPSGARRGALSGGARLNVIETLRAAAPWQPIRKQETGTSPRIVVRPDDVRITRLKQRSETVMIFVVDASGSSALHRLAEAKGAVELLLADCYVRRDQVALLAFRGTGAALMLPPTRSLVRAKRSLAALPGGGGTPLASALEAAGLLADGIRRKGQTPIIVLLTDGRANIARDGSAGRERAAEDAHTAARALRASSITSLLLDTSPQPQPSAAKIATEMGGRYVPLPHADAARLSRTILAATPR